MIKEILKLIEKYDIEYEYNKEYKRLSIIYNEGINIGSDMFEVCFNMPDINFLYPLPYFVIQDNSIYLVNHWDGKSEIITLVKNESMEKIIKYITTLLKMIFEEYDNINYLFILENQINGAGGNLPKASQQA